MSPTEGPKPFLSFRRRPNAASLVMLISLVAGTPAWAQSAGPTPVAASTVVKRPVAEGGSFVGSVMPVRESTVGSTVEERVSEFLVEEGDRVEAGQPLVKLRTRTLEIEVAGARAELEALRQELAELENGTRAEEVEQGRAELARAGALRDYAQAARRRIEDLIRQPTGQRPGTGRGHFQRRGRHSGV